MIILMIFPGLDTFSGPVMAQTLGQPNGMSEMCIGTLHADYLSSSLHADKRNSDMSI